MKLVFATIAALSVSLAGAPVRAQDDAAPLDEPTIETTPLDAAGEADDAEERQEPLEPADLDELFEDLAAAQTEEDAAFIAEEIETFWREDGGPTAELLVARALEAAEEGESAVARELVTGALELEPEYAWGWAQSALISFADSDHVEAIASIQHALELEPRLYEALFGLGAVLEDMERWEGAYAAYEQALEIYPMHAEARERLEDIAPRAHGRDL